MEIRPSLSEDAGPPPSLSSAYGPKAARPLGARIHFEDQADDARDPIPERAAETVVFDI